MQLGQEFVALDTSNTAFQEALHLVNHTGQHVFLTGKAGTGKTTFLKYLRQHTHKKLAIVAPTGVAAINAAGMTIHSMFSVAPSVYPPDDPRLLARPRPDQPGVSMKSHFQISNAKRKLFKALDLLVIDEISMVRCDLLDVIDRVLRVYGALPHEPFGGVQLLFIGDPYQLPPVSPDDDWNILSRHYASPHFFSALAWQKTDPRMVELTKVYRQENDTFVHTLNRVRCGQPTKADLHLLNRQCVPPSFDYAGQGYIYLGCTNKDVDQRNDKELKRLRSQEQVYQAKIFGDYKKGDMPCPDKLKLKVGAQVMFVKNDTGENRRFYNGKIGKVTKLNKDYIIVESPEDKAPIKVEPVRWDKIRYTWNQQERKVDEILTGYFEQYPLKLAWAITVHKSQGLTLEKVYANLANTFAPGQTYVALSRCTAISGLKLATHLQASDIIVDQHVKQFLHAAEGGAAVDQLLKDTAFMHAAEEVETLLNRRKLAAAVPAFYELKSGFPLYSEQVAVLEQHLMDVLQDLSGDDH